MQHLNKILIDNFHFDKEIIIRRGDYVKISGTTDTNFYFIKEGSLKIGIYNQKEDRILRFGYKNDIITALDSFLTGKKSEIYIKAIKKSHLAVISKLSFMDFIEKSVENMQLYTQILEKIIVEQLQREQDLLLPSPKERYQRILERNPKLFQEIPNRHIANYLDMTEETLSRLKKTLM